MAAQQVMERELRDCLPKAFGSAVAAAADARHPTLTSAGDLADSARGSGLAREITEALRRHRPAGAISANDVADAVSQAARSTAASHLRELDGYLAVEAPRERRAVMNRMRACLDKVDLPRLGLAVARGERISVTRRRLGSLDLDEDVR